MTTHAAPVRDSTPQPGSSLRRGRLREEWTLAFVVGELVGFVPPAVVGAGLAALDAPDAVLVVGLTAAGLCEGAVLGTAQARVLARHAPSIPHHRWIAATTAAAGLAWFVGMGGGALMGSEVLPRPLLLVVIVPAWVAALFAMGYGQWRVMRASVPRSGRWVWVNAAAWLAGVLIPIAALSAAPNSWPGWAHAAAGIAGAIAMGYTVGTITGRTLERLVGVRRARGRRHSHEMPMGPSGTAR